MNQGFAIYLLSNEYITVSSRNTRMNNVQFLFKFNRDKSCQARVSLSSVLRFLVVGLAAQPMAGSAFPYMELPRAKI